MPPTLALAIVRPPHQARKARNDDRGYPHHEHGQSGQACSGTGASTTNAGTFASGTPRATAVILSVRPTERPCTKCQQEAT